MQLGIAKDKLAAYRKEKRHVFPIKALEKEEIVEIAAGEFNSLALSKKGDVFIWGDKDSLGLKKVSPEAPNNLLPILHPFFSKNKIKVVSLAFFTFPPFFYKICDKTLGKEVKMALWGARRAMSCI